MLGLACAGCILQQVLAIILNPYIHLKNKLMYVDEEAACSGCSGSLAKPTNGLFCKVFGLWRPSCCIYPLIDCQSHKQSGRMLHGLTHYL